MRNLFKVGHRVTFKNDHGPQRGTVRHIVHSIENGQQFAVVDVDDILPGIMESVPLDHLRPEVSA